MSGYRTPKAGASWLPRGEYQMAPSFVIWIFGVSAARCGFGYSVKAPSRGLNFHNAAALPPTSALQMLPSGSWATSYGLAFCRGTVYSVILPVVWSNFAQLARTFSGGPDAEPDIVLSIHVQASNLRGVCQRRKDGPSIVVG